MAAPRLVAADPAQKLRDQLAAARADEAATRSRDRRRLASLVAGLPPSKPRVGPPTPTTASGPRQQQVRLPVADSEPSWVPAPEFDDDHSEELFYAPFPVSPYLTETPSIDDDALVVMRHPDASKTLAMLAESGGQPMVKWVRGRAIGQVRAALAFRGTAVRKDTNIVAPAEPLPPGTTTTLARY
ncbi:MAG: hypothetical protein AAFR60_01320 [Pseudomonadota bacterium]